MAKKLDTVQLRLLDGMLTSSLTEVAETLLVAIFPVDLNDQLSAVADRSDPAPEITATEVSGFGRKLKNRTQVPQRERDEPQNTQGFATFAPGGPPTGIATPYFGLNAMSVGLGPWSDL